ncbi:MAG TPA: D-TA family PLP-dependent enzyme [Blastocatellia bacterium]|nr:D-TA family PLP-dependent enzyme [Blastocatellia bacterium]
MATPAKALLLPDLSTDYYRIENIETVLTPALAIYPEIVDANIDITIRLLGDANRWRPHVKTAKLAFVMRRFVRHGLKSFKCSTTLELSTVCEAGASDVLVAYPAVGAAARRIRELAERFDGVCVSALAESTAQVAAWRGSKVGLFVDVNPGMNRTGVEQDRVDTIIEVAHSIESSGVTFRGLHYYDGHLSKYDLADREPVAHRGYDRLMKIVSALDQAGLPVGEVITAGTPAFPCTLSYAPFAGAPFTHRASPGTIVYNDCASLAQLPPEYGYRPAALVVSTVVSHPSDRLFTCDAGHKTVSADAGVPTCAILGRGDLLPLKPSEEHLPVEAFAGGALPSLGGALYLVPKHICPTVNNFDHALIIENNRIVGVERVTARGREAPVPAS